MPVEGTELGRWSGNMGQTDSRTTLQSPPGFMRMSPEWASIPARGSSAQADPEPGAPGITHTCRTQAAGTVVDSALAATGSAAWPRQTLPPAPLGFPNGFVWMPRMFLPKPWGRSWILPSDP